LVIDVKRRSPRSFEEDANASTESAAFPTKSLFFAAFFAAFFALAFLPDRANALDL
jgi:hypothetical protein